MKKIIISACVIAVLNLTFAALAAGDEAAPTTVAASEPTSAPTSMPATTVLTTVGKIEITAGQVDNLLSVAAHAGQQIPADKREMIRQRAIEHLIFQEFLKSYLKDHNLTCTDEELSAEKVQIEEIAKKMGMTVEQLMSSKGVTDEMLREKVGMNKLFVEATSKQSVDSLLKEHADYCDGTSVSASHILIVCSMYATADEQQEATKKLQDIAAEIKAGKISFEDAARKYSACPSKENGGDLGKFSFNQMVPAFAGKAFSMKAGEISEPVHSQFGYHIIKVTGRESPISKPSDEQLQAQAKNVLLGKLQEKIIADGLVNCPVVMKKS